MNDLKFDKIASVGFRGESSKNSNNLTSKKQKSKSY